MLRCAILDDYQDAARKVADWSPIASQVEIVALHDHYETDAAVIAALKDFDIVVAMRERTPFNAARLKGLPRLRLLVATGMSHPEIDFEATAAHGITVCGTNGVSFSTVELTWALILGLVRHLPEETAALAANGPWQSTLGMELHGRTLGLIGLGRLGSLVSRIGHAFGMKMIAWSKNLTRERCEEVGNVTLAPSLDALLQAADVATIHLALSPRTEGLIGAHELGRMKPTAFLVNTSRGEIIQEHALLEALTAGRIAGAGVDVFAHEPLPADHPFRRTPRLLATPHLGFASRDNYAAHYGGAVEDIAAWLAGTPKRIMTDVGARGAGPKKG